MKQLLDKRIKSKRNRVKNRIIKRFTTSFPIWPSKPKTLIISVPKSGTHLLGRCLELMPGISDTNIYLGIPNNIQDFEKKISYVYRGSFIKGHVPYDSSYLKIIQTEKIITFLMIRDPRDVVVSMLYWATYKYPAHRLRPYLLRLNSDSERIEKLITGILPKEIGDDRGLESIDKYFRIFLPWKEHGSCLTRFENLIGPSGNGYGQKQKTEILKIANHLSIPLQEKDFQKIKYNLISQKSTTFRRGKIGDWKNHFSQKHKDLFKDLAGQLMIDLGYEMDFDW